MQKQHYNNIRSNMILFSIRLFENVASPTLTDDCRDDIEMDCRQFFDT